MLVRYDRKMLAEKPLLSDFSVIMEPVLDANLRWTMATGEESPKLELRRHAGSPGGGVVGDAAKMGAAS